MPGRGWAHFMENGCKINPGPVALNVATNACLCDAANPRVPGRSGMAVEDGC